MDKRPWKVAKRSSSRKKRGKEQGKEKLQKPASVSSVLNKCQDSPESSPPHLPTDILDQILHNLVLCRHGDPSQNQHTCPWAGRAFNINELGGIMSASKWLRERCLELVFGCGNHPTIHLPYIETEEDRPSQFMKLPLLGKPAWRELNLAVSIEWRDTHSELATLAQLLTSMRSLRSLKLSVAIKSDEMRATEGSIAQNLPHLRHWEPIFIYFYTSSLSSLGFHLSVDAMPEDLIDPIRKDVIHGIRNDLMLARSDTWATDWGVKYFSRRTSDIPYQVRELQLRLSQMYSMACFRLPCLHSGESNLGPYDYYSKWDGPPLKLLENWVP